MAEPSGKPPVLAIGAIVRNESPYLLEWVAYHRVLGVDRFFIADDDSGDGTLGLLSALQEAGVVTAFKVERREGKPPQLMTYREIMRHMGTEADFIAFLDADEFLLPTDGMRSLRPWMQRIAAMPDVGAVAVNWAIYGSSGRGPSWGGMVVQRFVRRAEQEFQSNLHYKTIVRSAAFAGTSSNPHAFELREGFRYVWPSGEDMTVHPELGLGRSSRVDWTGVRLNHFAIKSYEEYAFRKQLRGRADIVDRKRPPGFFARFDRNEVKDPVPSWLVAATEAEAVRLLGRIYRMREPRSVSVQTG